jgi:lecithin-cholesterol acyltransferase
MTGSRAPSLCVRVIAIIGLVTEMRGRKMFGIVAAAVALAGLLLSAGASASNPRREVGLTPIVLFPAYHFTRLLVTVHDQRVDPTCPRSGSFEDFFPNPSPSPTFSQVCRDELMTLSYRPHGAWQTRFSDAKGVDVRIEDYGKAASAPFYQPMFDALRGAATHSIRTFASPATTRGSRLTSMVSSSGRNA